uniref:Extended synaptotagmin-1 n=1 Tax=Canis lupus dingo TaxID=286419 RepID=A0A8C0LQ83_CANLU
MERSPGASLVERASAPSDPPARPPGAHTQRDRTSGNQPAGPGAAAEALALLTSFGRRLLVLVPVYLAGAVGLSVGFVLFGLALYLGWRRVRDGKERSLRAARQLLDDEERLTAQTLYLSHRELPAWVSFPDVEKAEWLNKVRVGSFIADPVGFEHQVIPLTVAAPPSPSWSLPASPPPRLSLVPTLSVLFPSTPSYVGDVQIDVEVKKYFCKAGVKGMQLHGVLRVILEPLIGDLPIVGAVSMFFIRRPTLDINWTGMTNLLDIPGLSSLSDTMIMDSIAAFLVLPNRLLVPLVPDLRDAAQLRSPLPRGIVRIHLLAARGLGSKDKYVKGLIEGKSDPYALVRVGTQAFCSRVIDEDLNPQWGETYEVMVHEVPGQEIEVEVFDKDPDKDDFLGGLGQVHLRLEWLSLLPHAEKLEQVLQWNRGMSSRPEPPSAAILVVYLDRAQDLPLKKGNREPNPVVQLSIQDMTQESKAVYCTNSPVWEEAFRFFLQDPRSQELDVQVKDDSRALTLGALTVPLARLLTAPELTLDQWFQLSSSGPNSRLYMKLVMRILYLDSSGVHFPTVPGSPGAWDPDSENPQTGSSVDAPPRPYRTTPDSHFGTENVLRIHVLEAQDLIAKDRFLGGLVKGKSDPYVKLKLAGQSFRSRVVREDLNPRWNEVFEVIVTSIPGQELDLEVFDKDLDKDDFLGRCKVGLTAVLNTGFLDEWLTLEDVPSGRLHLRLERLTPRASAAELEEVLQVNSLIQTQKSTELAAALLTVYVERAEDLPLRKGTKPPSPYATLTMGDASYKTKTLSHTSAPVWEESASFLVKRPHAESLELQVRGEGGGGLGSLSLPLPELLAAEQLCLDQWFALNNGQGQVLLRAQLRVLVAQHSERGAPSLSPSSSSLSEEPELWGGLTHGPSSAPQLRQRLPHADRPQDAPAGPPGQVGQVQLTVWYHAEERRLVSIVHGCRALRQNGRDAPDPYVSLLLLPDKNRATKRKTSQKKKTLSPEFNERFEWELPLDEAQRRKLDVSVKSNASFMSRERELLGKVQLDLAEIDLSQGTAQW